VGRGPHLLFGNREGLVWVDDQGRLHEGRQIVYAGTLGSAYRRSRWLCRAQRRFLSRRLKRQLATMLLCLPFCLGQNTWVRVHNFLKKPRRGFLEKISLSHLGPFVATVDTFVENRRPVWRSRRLHFEHQVRWYQRSSSSDSFWAF
jgi:hypothetical protein